MFEELRRELGRLGIGRGFVVAGQSALRVWATHLGDTHLAEACTESRATTPLGSQRDVTVLAASMGRQILSEQGSRRELAAIDYVERGEDRAVRIVSQVAGARAPQVRKWSCTPTAPGKDLRAALRVMHPVHCLAMQIQETMAFEVEARSLALRRTEAAIACIRAYGLALLDAGFTERVLDTNEAVHRLCMTHDARSLDAEHELSFINALLVDPRLPVAFLEVRYPEMLLALNRQAVVGSVRARPRPDPSPRSGSVFTVETVSIGPVGLVYVLRDAQGSRTQHSGAHSRTARAGDYVRVRANGTLHVVAHEYWPQARHAVRLDGD